MKILYTAILPLFILFTAVSCNTPHAVEKTFAKTRNLCAEQIGISEVLKINNITKTTDYLILQNSSDGAGDFYFVYSLPDVNFLYSFGKRGRGPSEYLMPALIKNTPGNILGFKDHATDEIALYEISDTTAELQNSVTMHSHDRNRFFWEINLIEDSLLLVKHQGYKTGATELWNMKTELQDSIQNTFHRLPRKLGKDYYTIFDDYLIAANGNRFAISYFMIDRIEFGKVINSRIIRTSASGADFTPRFHLYGNDTDTEYSIDRNIVYYENIYAGKDFVYALYSNKRLDETEKEHSSTIEIYTWNGKPAEILNLDIPLAYMTVDESNKEIYGINPELYPDKILKYRF